MEEIATQASEGADSGMLGVYGDFWMEIVMVIFLASALCAGSIEPIARMLAQNTMTDVFRNWLLRGMSVAVGAGLGWLMGNSVLTPGLDLYGSIACGAAGGGAYTFFLPILKSLVNLRFGARLQDEGNQDGNRNRGHTPQDPL